MVANDGKGNVEFLMNRARRCHAYTLCINLCTKTVHQRLCNLFDGWLWFSCCFLIIIPRRWCISSFHSTRIYVFKNNQFFFSPFLPHPMKRLHVRLSWTRGWIAFIQRARRLLPVTGARRARCTCCRKRFCVWNVPSNRYVKHSHHLHFVMCVCSIIDEERTRAATLEFLH